MFLESFVQARYCILRRDLVRGIPINCPPQSSTPNRAKHNKTNLFCGLVAVPFMLCFPCDSAQAYIGPGVGAGVVAIVLGVVSSVFLLLVGIIYYPIKRAVKKLKGKDKLSRPADSLTLKRR